MSALITLTYDETIALLDRAVEEKGADYIYPAPAGNCSYFEPDGTCGCIFGHVFKYKGLEPAEYVDAAWNAFSVAYLHKEGIIACDDRTQRLMETVQEIQDGAEPWGEAVAQGKSVTAHG